MVLVTLSFSISRNRLPQVLFPASEIKLIYLDHDIEKFAEWKAFILSLNDLSLNIFKNVYSRDIVAVDTFDSKIE